MKKLITKVTLTYNCCFKQRDRCTMAYNYKRHLLAKLERAIVTPIKPTFYRHLVDVIFYRKGKYKLDYLYHKMNNYHCNINLIVEKDPHSS